MPELRLPKAFKAKKHRILHKIALKSVWDRQNNLTKLYRNSVSRDVEDSMIGPL